MSPAAADNWPMAPMAGHRPIAFRKRRSTVLPYSSRPRYRSSRSTLSVPAGSGATWAFFFFQAEDGIRDLYVTGVQTCALPISHQRTAVAQLGTPVVQLAGG